MTTHCTTRQPHAARGALSIGAWMPVAAFRPASRRPDPCGIGKVAGCGLAPH